jgi:DNA-binding transcriptional ArsR family regulator
MVSAVATTGIDVQASRQTDISRVAALIADPSRALILKALSDGRAVSATVLAAEAGVSAPTASVHLAKLVDSGLLVTERAGRNRYYRLAGGEVSAALEALAVIAPPLPVNSLRESSFAHALRRSRTCYDHVAGRLGVTLMQAMLERKMLTGHDGMHRAEQSVHDRVSAYGRDNEYLLTDAGRDTLTGFGVDPDQLSTRRPTIRYCVDWSERQHHLAGALGAAITTRLFDLDWLRYGVSPRVVHVTDTGRNGLKGAFGLEWVTDPG